MPDLAKLQELFGAGLGVAAPGIGAPEIFRGDPEAAVRRFGIYRGNARANAANALRAAYPVVEKIVGKEFFGGLAREYEANFPSTGGDLNEYGEAFATFLDTFEPASHIPYLGPVAQLEWEVHRAHYAADAAAFDPARLAEIPAERQPGLVPVLNPACALLYAKYPLARIWQIHQDGYDGVFDVEFGGEPAHAMVYRPRFKVEVSALSTAEAAFLEAARAGESLETAFAAAQARDAGFALKRALAEWVASKVVVDFAMNGE